MKISFLQIKTILRDLSENNILDEHLDFHVIWYYKIHTAVQGWHLCMQPILSFLNHQTRCNVCLDNSSSASVHSLSGLTPTQLPLNFTPSGFEDHLILWSIAIWLITSGRNGIKLQLVVHDGVAASCQVNKGVYFTKLCNILFKRNNIAIWAKKMGICFVGWLKRNFGYLKVG